MSVKIIKGNIFTSKCQTIVNTVNCVGVMGAGIALECRLRYPDMYERYKELCKEKKIMIGKLWIYKSQNKWILNFPTKDNWKHPSKSDYLRLGLKKFCDTYKHKNITSIAFPLLGADKGGIPPKKSIDIMREYLEKIDLDIEIYKYDKQAKDDLYEEFKSMLQSMEPKELMDKTGVGKDKIEKLISTVRNPIYCQLNQLLQVKGIGPKTLEKVFRYYTNPQQEGEQMAFPF